MKSNAPHSHLFSINLYRQISTSLDNLISKCAGHSVDTPQPEIFFRRSTIPFAKLYTVETHKTLPENINTPSQTAANRWTICVNPHNVARLIRNWTAILTHSVVSLSQPCIDFLPSIRSVFFFCFSSFLFFYGLGKAEEKRKRGETRALFAG